MTPEQFTEAWVTPNDPLNRFDRDALTGLVLSPGDLEFLTRAGLPDSAAPFLGFDTPRERLPTLVEEWQLEPEYARYRVIGANGSGDPICIDEEMQGSIVVLNHDDEFRVSFINTSAARLAETLLAFRRLVEAAISANGEDALLDNNVPEGAIAEFQASLKGIDPPAAKHDTFWNDQIVALRDGPYV